MLIVFGATHVTHHNSEKYNLSVLLGWAGHNTLNLFFYFCSFNGFDQFFFYMSSNRSTYQLGSYQYLAKCQLLLNIFCYTISCRVHHSTNDKYLIRILDQHYYLGQNIWDFSSRGRANSLWHYNVNQFI
jgi:hypothetical protein